MKWTGKIVGSLIGLALGNPFLIIAGLLLGHLFDIGWFAKWFGMSHLGGGVHNRVQGVFFNSTFKVMGFLAKSDGRVSENEIRFAEQVMREMSLDAAMRTEAIRLFNEGKSSGFDVDATLVELRQVCWSKPSLLKVFIEIQIKIAHVDGDILSPAKRQALEYVCRQLGIAGFNFNQFDQRYRAQQSYQRYQQSYQRPNDPRAHLSEAYAVLGVDATVSDADLKKAYRRLMSQNHPDKLMAKGLPPEMIKLATQKTQQIKKAYEQVCKARGIR